MRVSIPAIRGTMGGRQYYAISLSLAEVPRLFRFNDWEQSTPELRAQRVLNRSRVPVSCTKGCNGGFGAESREAGGV
jgi:hypothetical protein